MQLVYDELEHTEPRFAVSTKDKILVESYVTEPRSALKSPKMMKCL